MKKIVIMLLILVPLTGCVEEVNPEKFYGTWFPEDNIHINIGYYFDKSGELFKAIRINSEIFYMKYCNWEIQDQILVLCGQRLNFKFEGNKLYLYDFQDTGNEKCYIKVK